MRTYKFLPKTKMSIAHVTDTQVLSVYTAASYFTDTLPLSAFMAAYLKGY